MVILRVWLLLVDWISGDSVSFSRPLLSVSFESHPENHDYYVFAFVPYFYIVVSFLAVPNLNGVFSKLKKHWKTEFSHSISLFHKTLCWRMDRSETPTIFLENAEIFSENSVHPKLPCTHHFRMWKIAPEFWFRQFYCDNKWSYADFPLFFLVPEYAFCICLVLDDQVLTAS